MDLITNAIDQFQYLNGRQWLGLLIIVVLAYKLTVE